MPPRSDGDRWPNRAGPGRSNEPKQVLGGDAGTDAKIDQVADAVQEKTPDQVDAAVQQVAHRAKDAI